MLRNITVSLWRFTTLITATDNYTKSHPEDNFFHCYVVYYSKLWQMKEPNILPDPPNHCFGQ